MKLTFVGNYLGMRTGQDRTGQDKHAALLVESRRIASSRELDAPTRLERTGTVQMAPNRALDCNGCRGDRGGAEGQSPLKDAK